MSSPRTLIARPYSSRICCLSQFVLPANCWTCTFFQRRAVLDGLSSRVVARDAVSPHATPSSLPSDCTHTSLPHSAGEAAQDRDVQEGLQREQ
eukprot:9531500-Alexandrium_andersonii.AAC.1